MIKSLLKSMLSETTLKSLHRKRIEIFKGGYFGINDLDKKLEKYVDYDNGFYVELGANDGITQSNSYYFERKRHWRGVLIEPSPHNFLACYALRGKNNSVHCNACVSFDYTDNFVEMTYANLMSISNSLDLDLADTTQHLHTAQQYLKEKEKTFGFGAIAKPLSHILDESNAPTVIDFLSLDVEGAELEVLKGVDFEKYRFKFILVECRSIDRLKAYLSTKNYLLIDTLSEHDYLFASEATSQKKP